MKLRKEIYKKLLYYSSTPLNNISNLKLKISTGNQNNSTNSISQVNSTSKNLGKSFSFIDCIKNS